MSELCQHQTVNSNTANCQLVNAFLGWRSAFPVGACQACASDPLAPKQAGSNVVRTIIVKSLGIRVSTNADFDGESTKTLEESFASYVGFLGTRAGSKLLAGAITRGGMPAERATALAAANGIDLDAEV